MMSLADIHSYFPYILIIIGSLAFMFYPLEKARAVLFFIIGYFIPTAFYMNGMFTDGFTHYHLLVGASFLTILMYHSLEITVYLFCAWIIELLLILLNITMIAGWIMTPLLHWQITMVCNIVEFGLLLVNWGYGNTAIYHRMFDLDIPIFMSRDWDYFACPEGKEPS